MDYHKSIQQAQKRFDEAQIEAEIRADLAMQQAEQAMAKAESQMEMLGQSAIRMGSPGLAVPRHKRGRPVKERYSSTKDALVDYMSETNETLRTVKEVLKHLEERLSRLEGGQPTLNITDSLLCNTNRNQQFQIER